MKRFILLLAIIFLSGCLNYKYQTIIKKDGIEILNIITVNSPYVSNQYGTIIVFRSYLEQNMPIAIIEKPFQNCIYEIETKQIIEDK
jgi:hypothetical protein